MKKPEKQISDEALDIMSFICRKRGSLPKAFRASDLTKRHCAGHKRVDTVEPLLMELSDSNLLKEEEFSHGSYKYTTSPIESIPLVDYLGSIPEEPKDSEPEYFSEVELPENYLIDLEEEIKKYQVFVVLTAVVDKPVNKKFLASIKNYAKRRNALILVLPSDIHNKKRDEDSTIKLDPALREFRLVYKDLYLNKNLCICSIKTSAKQIKTLTGLDRIATAKDASIIVASTKLFEECVPAQKGKIPLRVATTGAITENNYATDRYMSKRTAYIAETDHMYGAVVVEVANNDLFYMRAVEGSKADTFTDLGVEYKPDGSIEFLTGSVCVLGDSHTDKLNKRLHKCILRMIDDLRVDTAVLHDVFNATSVTHHDKGKNLTKAMKANEDRASLEKEGEGLKAYLEDLRKHLRNLTIVNSNHDRHLEGYLEEGRYIGDPVNSYVAHKLAIAYMEKKNPVQFLVETLLGLETCGIKWLKQDEEYVKYGVSLGHHGDQNATGGRGSLAVFEKSLCNCVTAHTHSAKRLRRACCVGVVGELDQGYNKSGLSAWTHAICMVYSNGTKQLIHLIPDKTGTYRYTID